jgi:hypothetical protein
MVWRVVQIRQTGPGGLQMLSGFAFGLGCLHLGQCG